MCYREMYFTESELDFRQKESTEHHCSVLNCVLYLEYCTGQNTSRYNEFKREGEF